MALFGGLGKAIGLGSAKQVGAGLTQIGASLTGASGLGTGLSNIFGGITGGAQQGQAVAVDAPAQTVPQETAQSSQAAVGGIVPYLAPGSRMLGDAFRAIGKFAGSPVGGVAIGTGLGAGLNMIGGDGEQKIRFTRKQQMQVKEMVELVGFDMAMQILGVDAATLAFMLTKKFPRRGQGITAAQLRTAQRVNNKVIHMHDKLKAAYGSTTRRTTARRTASTRVTQIKN